MKAVKTALSTVESLVWCLVDYSVAQTVVWLVAVKVELLPVVLVEGWADCLVDK